MGCLGRSVASWPLLASQTPRAGTGPPELSPARQACLLVRVARYVPRAPGFSWEGLPQGNEVSGRKSDLQETYKTRLTLWIHTQRTLGFCPACLTVFSLLLQRRVFPEPQRALAAVMAFTP